MEPTNLNGPLFESFFWIQAAPLHAKAAALASAAPPKPARDKGGKDGTAAVKVKSPTNLVPQVLWHYPEDVSRIAAEFRDIPQFCFPGIAASHLSRAGQLNFSCPTCTDLDRMRLESCEEGKLEHFAFTMTDSKGRRMYGVCLRGLFKGAAGGRRWDDARPDLT